MSASEPLTPEERAVSIALLALRLEVPSAIADDVERKVHAAIIALRARLVDAERLAQEFIAVNDDYMAHHERLTRERDAAREALRMFLTAPSGVPICVCRNMEKPCMYCIGRAALYAAPTAPTPEGS